LEQHYLTIAIPKGALFGESVDLLRKSGLQCTELTSDSRKMLFIDHEDQAKYIICRPTDIPTFVEYGAADLGLSGKDTIVEQRKDVYELLDLKYGCCRFVVAVPQALAPVSWEQMAQKRVATKFPRVAENFFREKGLQVEVIKLHGNIELAPIVGLSEMIVDIVSTGRTLRENNLIELEEIFKSSARLIANRASLHLKRERINPLMEKMRQAVESLKV
jgi:ATP phosphoribosyltransferase